MRRAHHGLDPVPGADPPAGYSSVFSISAIFSGGKRGSHRFTPLTPLLHLRLSRLGPVGIAPAPARHTSSVRGRPGSGPPRPRCPSAVSGGPRHLQVLPVVGHGDVAEHLEIQRGAAEADEADAGRRRVDLRCA